MESGNMLKRGIPNAFTLGNLYCGFLSVGFAAQGQYKNAAILILIGMMLDSMDGRLARMLNAASELGKELDSLADVVTFGVAPAFLVYYTSFIDYGLIGYLVAALFPLFGAFRLARFNVKATASASKYFTGVPITAAGGIIALLTLFGDRIPNIVISVTFTALCFLMVSKVKIPSLKEIPLPKYGTIITVFLGCAIYIVYMQTYEKFPFFIYVAIPLYIAYIGYQIKKNKKSNLKNN
jgi:CDP-diacylglycerol---serine O-phosphatidyltransferase